MPIGRPADYLAIQGLCRGWLDVDGANPGGGLLEAVRHRDRVRTAPVEGLARRSEREVVESLGRIEVYRQVRVEEFLPRAVRDEA